MNGRRLRTSVVLAAALATGLAACGSSSSGGGATASGGSFRVMVEGLMTPAAALGGIALPYGANGVRAAAAAINAAGGINGRRVEVDVCDGKGDPNTAAQCGRTARKNGDIAVVGTFDPIGAPQLVSVLEAEKIPFIGGLPGTPKEYSSSVSFQYDPGPVLTGPALVSLWQARKCTKVVNMVPAAPGNDALLASQKAAGRAAGISVTDQLVNLPVADVTPILSSVLAGNPDCFSYIGDGPTSVKFVLGARKQGFTGTFVTATASLLTPFLKALGDKGNGIYALNSVLLPTSDDPMVATFRSELSSYLGGDQAKLAENLNEFAQDGWSSMQVLKLALAKSTSFTTAEVLKQVPTLKDVNIGNVYPHISFDKPVATSTTLPRVFNDQWQYVVSKDGAYVPTDGAWHDLSGTIPT